MSVIERLNLMRLRAWGLRSQSFHTSEGRLHLLSGPGTGTGPPVVLVHGVSSQATQYRKLVAVLRRRHRALILPDLLAHGDSETPPGPLHTARLYGALRELLDHALDEPVVLFGNSLGGYLAVRYAAERPERVRALVVHSPGGGPLPLSQRAQLLARFQLDSHAKALELVDRSLVDIGLLRQVAAVFVRQQLKRPHIQALLSSVTEQDELSPDHLARLRMPTLLLWGQRDRVMEEEQFQFFRQYLPEHARVDRPHDYGHTPHLERADDLAHRIQDFLNAHEFLRQD